MYVLLGDELGALTLRRLWPWHRILARGRAGWLDRQLAAGASPEANASLAARAARLTSMEYRRDLATSLRRILAEAGEPTHSGARSPRVPLRTSRINRSAPLLVGLASRLARPGPVPARGVAMISELLADGAGPLYREDSREDLAAAAERAADALTGAGLDAVRPGRAKGSSGVFGSMSHRRRPG